MTMNLLDLFVKIGVKDEASAALEDAATNAIAKGNLISSAVSTVVGLVKSAVSNAIDGIKSVVSGAMEQFGQYEQNIGGMETFFGEAAKTVISNAKEAYSTAGMSANEYMSNVSGFAMTLINSVAKERQDAAKGDTDAQKAELDQQYEDLKANLDKSVESTRDAMNDEIDQLKRNQQDHKTEVSRTLSDELEEKKRSYSDAIQNLKDSLADEVAEFKQATDDKIDEINREYTEKLKLTDEAKYNAIKAIEDEIDALNEQTQRERDAMEEQSNNRRLAELQARIDSAETYEEREKALEDYNDFVAKLEQQQREKSRQEQIESLRQQKDETTDYYSRLTDDIKAEQQQVTDDYKAKRAEELEVLQTTNAQKVEDAQTYYDGLVKQQQRANEDALTELDRANAAEVEKAQQHRDETIEAIKTHNEQVLEEEKATIEAAKAELDGVGEIIEILSEDQQKAAEIADMIMTDMSDNANKMGEDMTNVQNAYQGFARGNATMLDNLHLGYQGNKEELERLLTDAENIKAKYGEVADYSSDSFADIAEAIHVVQVEAGISGVSVDELKQKMENNDFTLQELNKLGKAWAGEGEDTDSVEANIERARSKLEEMGGEMDNFSVLLGTTATESMTTYEGAMGRVKGAWDNWLAAIADPENDPADETETLIEEVGNAAALIIPRVTEILKTLAKEVGEKAPEIWETFKTALENSMTDEQKQKFEDFKNTIDTINTVVAFLAYLIKGVTGIITWAGDEIQGFIDTFEGVKDFFGLVPSLILDAFGDKTILEGNGKAIMEGFTKAATYEWDWQGKGFFENLAGWIKANKGPVEEDRKLLQPAGEAIMQGFYEGASGSEWETVKKFFEDIQGEFEGEFVGADQWLDPAGSETLKGLSNGLDKTWKDIEDFLGEMETEFESPFTGSDAWLTSGGSDIISGLTNGIGDKWTEVETFLNSMMDGFVDPFNNAMDWLQSAGQNIINGLYDGLVDAWNNNGITDFISNIGNWIADNKGPEEYDKKLLKPAGKWIMGSLKSGLEESFKRDVMPFVESMAEQMEDGFGNPILTASAGINGSTSRLARGGAPQIVIEHMEVRNEQDIYSVSRQLNEIWQLEGAGSLA